MCPETSGLKDSTRLHESASQIEDPVQKEKSNLHNY